MIHGSTFVEEQMLNGVSRDVEQRNMSFNMLKAVERK